MMKIKLLRGVGIRGAGYAAGAVVEVDDGDAQYLIQMKKAELVPEPVKAVPVKVEPESMDLVEEPKVKVVAKPKSTPRKAK